MATNPSAPHEEMGRARDLRPLPSPDFQTLFETAPDLYLVLDPALTSPGYGQVYAVVRGTDDAAWITGIPP